jgi:hypothetical protein
MGVIERFLERMVAHDWDDMAACLADDFERVGPYGDVKPTKAEYLEFISALMPTLPGYSMKVDRVLYGDRAGWAELSETVEIDGVPVETPEGLVFDLDDQGLISRVAVYVQTKAH